MFVVCNSIGDHIGIKSAKLEICHFMKTPATPIANNNIKQVKDRAFLLRIPTACLLLSVVWRLRVLQTAVINLSKSITVFSEDKTTSFLSSEQQISAFFAIL